MLPKFDDADGLRADLARETFEAVKLPFGVHRLADAVGENGQKVARCERPAKGLVRIILDHPERQAGRFLADLLDRPAAVPQERRHVAGVHEDQVVVLRVENRNDHRDESVFPVAARKQAVDSIDRLGRIGLAGQVETDLT